MYVECVLEPAPLAMQSGENSLRVPSHLFVAVSVEDLVLRTTLKSLEVPYSVVLARTSVNIGFTLDPFDIVLEILVSYPLSKENVDSFGGFW